MKLKCHSLHQIPTNVFTLMYTFYVCKLCKKQDDEKYAAYSTGIHIKISNTVLKSLEICSQKLIGKQAKPNSTLNFQDNVLAVLGY